MRVALPPHRRDGAVRPLRHVAGRGLARAACVLWLAAMPAAVRAQAPADARFGTGDLNLVVVPRTRAAPADPAKARTAKPIAPATRALMWRRPTTLGPRLSPTGALAPR